MRSMCLWLVAYVSNVPCDDGPMTIETVVYLSLVLCFYSINFDE